MTEVINSRESILNKASRSSKVFEIENLGAVRIAELTHGQRRAYFARMLELRTKAESGEFAEFPREMIISFAVVDESLVPILSEEDIDALPCDVVDALFKAACELNQIDDYNEPPTEEEIEEREEQRVKAMFTAAFGPPVKEESSENG